MEHPPNLRKSKKLLHTTYSKKQKKKTTHIHVEVVSR